EWRAPAARAHCPCRPRGAGRPPQVAWCRDRRRHRYPGAALASAPPTSPRLDWRGRSTLEARACQVQGSTHRYSGGAAGWWRPSTWTDPSWGSDCCQQSPPTLDMNNTPTPGTAKVPKQGVVGRRYRRPSSYRDTRWQTRSRYSPARQASRDSSEGCATPRRIGRHPGSQLPPNGPPHFCRSGNGSLAVDATLPRRHDVSRRQRENREDLAPRARIAAPLPSSVRNHTDRGCDTG